MRAELNGLFDLLEARTQKIYRGGSARARTPEETWSLIAPLLSSRPSFGISRVANVTGLDHVGIPVYQAIRPQSRSLSVSQGKGADIVAAKVSAVMEAIELSFAERPRCLLRLARFRELTREGLRTADPSTLPHTRDYDPDKSILWTEGVDIVAREAIWVPFDLVHIDLTAVPSSEMLVTSNGLASGNNLAEAAFHGLCEVIERDAAGLFALREDGALTSTLIDLEHEASADTRVRALIDRLRDAGLTPLAWNMTTDIGLPAIRAYLFDTQAHPTLNPISAAYGAGCHIDAPTALVRALTESAQTRVGWIAGSRDDLSRDAFKLAQATSLHLDDFRNLPRVRLDALPRIETPTVEEDLACILDALRRAGLEQVIVVPLSSWDSTLPVSIVRVLVPGLEGPSDPNLAPGPRAAKMVAAS